ncbi:MAG: hypothetical protein AMXMBFR81_20710 [Chthonomonas sp.]
MKPDEIKSALLEWRETQPEPIEDFIVRVGLSAYDEPAVWVYVILPDEYDAESPSRIRHELLDWMPKLKSSDPDLGPRPLKNHMVFVRFWTVSEVGDAA